MDGPLEPLIERYIARHLPGAAGIRVSGLERIAGGASRETFRLLLDYADQDGQPVSRRLILRRDLPSSLLESERRIEFGAYRAFLDTPVPVPEMLWLEEDVSILGHPFFIAEEISGFTADPAEFFTADYDHLRGTIGARKWEMLGQVAAQDPERIGYHALFDPPALEDVWRIQLDYWEGVLDEDAIRVEPILRAMIRWMRRNPPPPPLKLSVVHGDFRSGNFLYDREGGIRALLDWEMTHLGDPMEDLGWSFNRIWCFEKNELRGGLLHRDDAIAAWERGSGMKVDPQALHWWEMLASVKGQGLWVSAGNNAIHGGSREMIHFGTAWNAMNSQDRAVLELMGR